MTELTDAQKALRDKLRKDAADAERDRELRGEPISKKFSGPIGLDDQGRPFKKPDHNEPAKD